jgi:OOP family OmpA-OmpF porin
MSRIGGVGLRAGLLLVLASVVSLGQAQEAPAEEVLEMRPYISELLTYTFEDDSRLSGVGNTDYGLGWQLSVGKALNRYWGVEFGAFYSRFGVDDDAAPATQIAMREHGVKVDGLFFYSRKPTFSPYFSVGVGQITSRIKGTSNDSDDPMADVGLGFFKYFNVAGADLGFRADLRYRRIFFDDNAFGVGPDDLGEAVLKVGLVLPLGKGAKAAPAPAAAQCADADGDGVCDTADLCPGTETGTVVDAKGCPKEQPGDGPNKKFEDVRFAFDKSDLTDYAKATLDNAATTINGLTQKYPGLKVDLSGHTDWVGTDGYNQSLSERRANAVKSYLIRKGVDANRINTYAYGEAKPIATNETAEGRAMNRRTEVQTRGQ